MKRIVLGFILGAFLAATGMFLLYPNPGIRIDIGRMLDEDIVYLKDGTVMRGWVINKTSQNILLEIEGGSLTLPVSKCEVIKENVLLRYTRKLL